MTQHQTTDIKTIDEAVEILTGLARMLPFRGRWMEAMGMIKRYVEETKKETTKVSSKKRTNTETTNSEDK